MSDQLQLELGPNFRLPELEDADERAIDPAEAWVLSNNAKTTLEDGVHGDVQWMNDYIWLREKGYPWRVCAYMAWASCPRGKRWPETQAALATDVLGLKSDRVIREWRTKNPSIEATIAKLRAHPLMAHRREVMEALAMVAKDPDYKAHNDRELFFKMTGDYVPQLKAQITGKPKDLSELSDAELAELERQMKAQAEDVD